MLVELRLKTQFAEWQSGQLDMQTAANSAIAKADPNDPNADLNVLLGITDKA